MAKPRKEFVPPPVDDILAFEDDLASLEIEDAFVPSSEPEEVETSEKVSEEPEVPEEKPKPVAEPPSEVLSEAVGGWMPIASALRNGLPIRIAENPEGEGTLVFWKRTRAFANPTHRWQEIGKWTDFITGGDVAFIPQYWKPRFEQ